MNARLVATLAFFSPISIAVLLQSRALQPVLTAEYSPRRALYFAHPWLLWTNVISDVLISLSYVLFFFGIRWLVKKLRHIPDIQSYLWVFAAFRVFILASGATCIIRIVNVWWPLYQFSVALKVICAAASVPTAVLFAWEAPAMAASVRRFFNLLRAEQRQSDALRKSEDFLDRTNRIAGIGGFEIDLETSKVTWTAELYRIHGTPSDFQPTIEDGLAFYTPESRPIIAEAVERAFTKGDGWDLELSIVRADGQMVGIRTVGEVDFRDGKPFRLSGTFQDITARVADREAMRLANERIQIATDSGGIGIWDWDLVTGELYCDDWMHRLHGKDPADRDANGLWRDHLHPDDKARVVQALEDAVAGIAPYDTEFRIVWPDGSIHHLRGSARVTRDADGRPLRMAGANWDVSARVEAENALRTASERATLATESGGIGIFEWDLTTDACTCDSWMYRLHDLQKTSETTSLEFWTQHMHPDDKQPVIEALNDAIAGPDPYNTEYRVVWNNGTVHHLRATGLVRRDKRGRAVSMVGANWDVTESRRLTEELAQQHELLRVTLDSICDGVITVDLNHKVTWLNPAAERLTGWTNGSGCGQPLPLVFKTLNEETRDPLENPLASRTAHTKAAGLPRRTLLVSRSGAEFAVENAVAPIRNNFGELLGYVLVFRDVTEQRRLAAETEHNAKLRLELKLKDDFLSHVSHELRSPLTSIYSFTSIVADDLAGDTTPEQKQYLQIVLKNVVQLQAMIEDLLTVTQSREGKLGIDLQRVVLSDAITDALNTVRSAASTKSIALSADDVSGLPPACWDPTRLRQVLIILLDNAIKFTPSGGSVTVSASQKEIGFLQIQVADTGCGIPEDKRLLVFENLYQVTGPAPADTSHLGRVGLGLGLHIARNLVQRQGGNIWVTEAPSGGSIFNFTLPIFAGECAVSPASANAPRRRKTDRHPEPVSPAAGTHPAELVSSAVHEPATAA